jgi:hypothetical protein
VYRGLKVGLRDLVPLVRMSDGRVLDKNKTYVSFKLKKRI